jgi:hypothetical protein
MAAVLHINLALPSYFVEISFFVSFLLHIVFFDKQTERKGKPLFLDTKIGSHDSDEERNLDLYSTYIHQTWPATL